MIMKEPDKSVWENNYKNKSISGIEIRDKNGELVNFITIRHDEILEKDTTHRIVIGLDENSKLQVPPPKTFEEIIQAKRRQQMLLYGSGNSTSSTSSSAIISSRTARRVAAARQVAVTAASRATRPPPRDRRRPSSKKSKKKKPPPQSRPPLPPANPQNGRDSNLQDAPTTAQTAKAEAAPAIASASAIKLEPCLSAPEPVPSTSTSTSISTGTNVSANTSSPTIKTPKKSHSTKSQASNHMVTSLKDLTKKDNPLLKSIDPKEVKMLLKSATPGATIVLPNGTVIKKSRRGGARAGAGRKRSRPIDPNQPGVHQLTSNDSQQQSIQISNEQSNHHSSIDMKDSPDNHIQMV